MSTHESVHQDERTLAVVNSSYAWAYIFMTYALLLDVMYRGLVRQEAAWDLMGLVIGGGVFCGIYQARQKILARGWVVKVALVSCIAAVIAFLAALGVGM
jgi:hypothetical protein